MIDWENAERAVDCFVCNPYWKSIYDNAPTGRMKEYYAMEFYYSWLSGRGAEYEPEKQAAADRIKELENAFGLEECRYAVKYCGHNPKRSFFHNRILALSDSGDDEK